MAAPPSASSSDPGELQKATAKDLPDIVRRLFAEIEDDFATAFSMQKQLGGRTDTLKQTLIDQKESQLEQLKENLPELSEADVDLVRQIQDMHLERLWSVFIATGNPVPPSPLSDEPTIAAMLRQLGAPPTSQSKADKDELMAQFAQQLEAERRKTLQLMENQTSQFEQEKQALKAREEQLRLELSKMQKTEEELKAAPGPKRESSPTPEAISGHAMSRARQNSVLMKMPQPIRGTGASSPTDGRPIRTSAPAGQYPSPISPRGQRAQTGTLIVPRRPSNVDMTKAPYQLMQGDQPGAPGSVSPRPGDTAKDPSTRSYESTEALLVENKQDQRSCWSSCTVM